MNEKTPKITFAALTIELTRRCNMACIHCMRGEPQDVSISYAAIDSFLQHTNGIYNLQFSGGEPFLAVDMMQHIIDGIKERRIFLGGLGVITNGTVKNDSVVTVVKDFAEYIKTCVKPDLKIQSLVHVGVSVDTFHQMETDSESCFDWYKSHLSEYATVTRAKGGEFPEPVGRAEGASFAHPASGSEIPLHKIEYIAPGHTPICQMRKRYKSFFPQQITVLCRLYVTARGNAVDIWQSKNTFEALDSVEPVFSLPIESSAAIMKQIQKYNEKIPYCVEPPISEAVGEIGKSTLLEALKRHPNPKDALKWLKVCIARHSPEIYTRLFEGDFDLTEEELYEYSNGYGVNLPANYVERLEENTFTPDERRKLLLGIFEEQCGDYTAQVLDAEKRIRQKAISKVQKNLLDTFGNPLFLLAVKRLSSTAFSQFETAMRQIREMTFEDAEQLNDNELKSVYSETAIFETYKKLAELNEERYGELLSARRKSFEREIESIAEAKANKQLAEGYEYLLQPIYGGLHRISIKS